MKGTDVMAVGNNGRTPIHHTAQVSLGDAIWALVENSIDVRAVDKDGRTLLHLSNLHLIGVPLSRAFLTDVYPISMHLIDASHRWHPVPI